MSDTAFDDLTDVYEAMIDWPKRLTAEGAFLKRLFEQAQVQRVADVACGAGKHAAMFHTWGLEVEGSDISPNMIDRARASFGEPAGLRWAVRGFDQPAAAAGTLDAVVCLGNSLSLAPNRPAAADAVGQMLRAVRPGGLVIVSVLNLWKLPDGPMVWQKIVRQPVAGRPMLILKGVHRSGDTGWVELVVVPDDPSAGHRTHSVPFLGLTADELTDAARPLAASIEFFGGPQGKPYDPATSGDLVMVATRSA